MTLMTETNPGDETVVADDDALSNGNSNKNDGIEEIVPPVAPMLPSSSVLSCSDINGTVWKETNDDLDEALVPTFTESEFFNALNDDGSPKKGFGGMHDNGSLPKQVVPSSGTTKSLSIEEEKRRTRQNEESIVAFELNVSKKQESHDAGSEQNEIAKELTKELKMTAEKDGDKFLMASHEKTTEENETQIDTTPPTFENLEANEEVENANSKCQDADVVPISCLEAVSSSTSGEKTSSLLLTLEDMMKICRVCKIVLERCDDKSISNEEEPQSRNCSEAVADDEKVEAKTEQPLVVVSADSDNRNGKTSCNPQFEESAPSEQQESLTKQMGQDGQSQRSNRHYRPQKKVATREPGLRSKRKEHSQENHSSQGNKKTKNIKPEDQVYKIRGRPANSVVLLTKSEIQAIKSYRQVTRLSTSGEHECLFCGRRFPIRTSLITHLRIHTGERPYRCKLCGMAFKQMCHVQQHSKTFHEVVISRDDIDFVPGRVEILASKSPRKPVIRKNDQSSAKIVQSTASRQLFCAKEMNSKQQAIKRNRYLNDPELIDAFDIKEKEPEIVESENLRNHIKECNDWNKTNRWNFVDLRHPDIQKMVEVETDLLMGFLRPFLNDSEESQNSGGNLFEMHSQIRDILGMDDKGKQECHEKTDMKSKRPNKPNETEFCKRGNGLRLKSRRAIPSKRPNESSSTPVNISSYPCPKCDMKFSVKLHLRKHITESHVAHNREDLPYKCNICPRTYKLDSGLKQHMKEFHGPNGRQLRRFKCTDCNSSFSHERSLRSHIRQNHGPLQSSTGGWRCGECGKRFGLKKVLDAHMIIHSESAKVLSCLTCSMTFLTEDKLDAHVLSHRPNAEEPAQTENKILEPKVFKKPLNQAKKQNRLKRPKKSSAGTKELLNRNSTNQVGYHAAGGYKAKQQCKICSAWLTNRGSLAVHMRMHSGEKPYVCKLCGIKFVIKGNLRKHMSVHLGTLNHKCAHCDVAFSTPNALGWHMKRSHPEVIVKSKKYGKKTNNISLSLENVSKQA